MSFKRNFEAQTFEIYNHSYDSAFGVFRKGLNPIQPTAEKSPQENHDSREQEEDQNAKEMKGSTLIPSVGVVLL